MPGAGKTHIGRMLSARYKLPLIDTDKAVERAEGKPVTEVFAEHGEAYFRALETAALAGATAGSGAVISCGGGIVVTEKNVKILKDNCFVVFLRAKVETLLRRVKSGETRPLLAGDPEGKIYALLSARAALYERAADYIIDVDADDPAAVASEIMAAAEKAGVTKRGTFTGF